MNSIEIVLKSIYFFSNTRKKHSLCEDLNTIKKELVSCIDVGETRGLNISESHINTLFIKQFSVTEFVVLNKVNVS